MINYKYYGIFGESYIKKLDKKYAKNQGQFYKDIKSCPYHVMIDIAEIPWKIADSNIIKYKLAEEDCYERCQYATYAALKQNESKGNTRIKDAELAEEVNNLAHNSIRHITTVVNNDDKIYYDAKSHYVALVGTYNSEKNIAYHIHTRLKRRKKPLDVDIEKYRHGDIELTDEQMSMLEAVKNNRICMLNGAAGCVDCDTEFFTGYRWKRIADYEVGDKVLQYNDDGTAELVEPLAYIKKSTDYLWHFETKYGVNQTLCDEHNIVYWSPKKAKHECKISDIINDQLHKKSGWDGRFRTTFAYSGSGIDLTDEQIRVMCAVICDGSFYSKATEQDKSYYRCRFHVKKERKHERLRLLFSQANIEWKEVKSAAEGYVDFYINAPMRTKQFDDYWYNCSQHQLQVICDEIMFWDGHTNTTKAGTVRNRFSTTIKETADFLQFAFSACSQRATISVNDRSGQQYFTCGKWYTRKSAEYNVVTTNRIEAGICCDGRPNHIRTMPEQVPTTDGYKYCFTVPSHMLVLRRKDCIFITGNCGKTSTTNAVLDMLDDANKSYACMAFTGIASKQLNLATNRPSSTIHMFLTNPWQPDYVIIDEISTVSIHLLSRLLDAIGTKPNLIFIGDSAQLASISCGSLLRDIISYSAVPRVNLTKIFRYNTSGIVTIATDTRYGISDNLTKQYDDYMFIPTGSEPINQVVNVYDDLIKQGYTMDDVAILCPFKKRNGTREINEILSEKYNKNPTITPKSVLKIGDKVINIKNDYSDGELLANGDIGYLLSYKPDEILVKFDFGVRQIQSLQRIEQATALTIHKVQGSSFKVVILYVDKPHEFFLTSNLLYTAVTRAREKLIVIGDLDSIKTGLTVSDNDGRMTWLSDLLNN